MEVENEDTRDSNSDESGIQNLANKSSLVADESTKIEESKENSINPENVQNHKENSSDQSQLNMDYSEFPDGTVTSLTHYGLRKLIENSNSMRIDDQDRNIIVQIIKVQELQKRPGAKIKTKIHISDGIAYSQAVILDNGSGDEVNFVFSNNTI